MSTETHKASGLLGMTKQSCSSSIVGCATRGQFPCKLQPQPTQRRDFSGACLVRGDFVSSVRMFPGERMPITWGQFAHKAYGKLKNVGL